MGLAAGTEVIFRDCGHNIHNKSAVCNDLTIRPSLVIGSILFRRFALMLTGQGVETSNLEINMETAVQENIPLLLVHLFLRLLLLLLF